MLPWMHHQQRIKGFNQTHCTCVVDCSKIVLRYTPKPLDHSRPLSHLHYVEAPLLTASSFENIPSRGLFCFKCKHCNFSNDSKVRRSHAQHQQNFTGLSKCGVKVSGLHVSGTDPLPLSSFLTKKRRINEMDFNFAYQLDNYLTDIVMVIISLMLKQLNS